MGKDIITLRGKRDIWIDFVNKVRKEHKEVWQVLEPLLKKYIKQ